jgi:hypothetical protein
MANLLNKSLQTDKFFSSKKTSFSMDQLLFTVGSYLGLDDSVKWIRSQDDNRDPDVTRAEQSAFLCGSLRASIKLMMALTDRNAFWRQCFRVCGIGKAVPFNPYVDNYMWHDASASQFVDGYYTTDDGKMASVPSMEYMQRVWMHWVAKLDSTHVSRMNRYIHRWFVYARANIYRAPHQVLYKCPQCNVNKLSHELETDASLICSQCALSGHASTRKMVMRTIPAKRKRTPPMPQRMLTLTQMTMTTMTTTTKLGGPRIAPSPDSPPKEWLPYRRPEVRRRSAFGFEDTTGFGVSWDRRPWTHPT